MFPTLARPPPLAGRLVTWPRTEPKVLRCAPQLAQLRMHPLSMALRCIYLPGEAGDVQHDGRT